MKMGCLSRNSTTQLMHLESDWKTYLKGRALRSLRQLCRHPRKDWFLDSSSWWGGERARYVSNQDRQTCQYIKRTSYLFVFFQHVAEEVASGRVLRDMTHIAHLSSPLQNVFLGIAEHLIERIEKSSEKGVTDKLVRCLSGRKFG